MNPNINTGKTVQDEIDNMKKRRDERKIKESRKITVNNNHEIIGKRMDKDYEKMIRNKKSDIFSYESDPHIDIDNSKIFVVVRKWPLSKKEISNGEIDCISCLNQKVTIHECKIKIDGITKYRRSWILFW